jgi:hypothetical protein
MKLRTLKRDVEYSGAHERTAFSIKASGKAFQILSSGLYRDKIRAIVRELSCNALDSHIAAGHPERPFDVFLPTPFEPVWSIRDYGTGLSDDDIKSIFTTYFESTKTECEIQTGTLGLGSKSGFSYVDSFTVISYFNGEKRSYTAYIDEESLPNIVQMGETEFTAEDNGLHIIIPVKREDMREFENRSRMIYRQFAVLPNFPGRADFVIEKPDPVIAGPDYRVYQFDFNVQSGCFAIMGPVAYPVVFESLSGFSGFRSKYLQKIASRMRIEIDFAMGDVEFTAGREDLSYDPKVTVPNLSARVAAVEADFEKQMSALFDGCKTHYEALVRYNEVKMSGMNPLLNMIPSRWRDIDLSKAFVDVDVELAKEVSLRVFETSHYSIRGPVVRETLAAPSPNKTRPINMLGNFVVDDSPDNKLRARIRNNLKETIYVISGDKEKVDEFLTKVDGVPVKLASTLALPPPAQRAKITAYVTDDGYRERLKRVDIDPDLDTCYYIVTKYGSIDNLCKWESFPIILSYARDLKVIASDQSIHVLPSTIVKRTMSEMPDCNWINLTDLLHERAKTYLADESIAAAARAQIDNEGIMQRHIVYLIKALAKKIRDDDHLLSEFERLHGSRGVTVPALRTILKLLSKLGYDLDLAKRAPSPMLRVLNEFEARYPMLTTIQSKWHDSTYVDLANDYISQIDELWSLRNTLDCGRL